MEVDKPQKIVCVLCFTAVIDDGNESPRGWLDLDGWQCPQCAGGRGSAVRSRRDDDWEWPDSGVHEFGNANDPRERPTLPVPADDDG